jgi:NH3-dependent NAD+ synthetase
MQKQAVIDEMKVLPEIDVEYEVARRVSFIKKQLLTSGLNSLVLGISGGIDSCTLGRLAQLAVNELNEEHHESYQFIAVRLPYDTQADEEDAQKSIDFIQPTHSVAVNVFMPQRLRRYPMQTFFLLAKQSKTLSKEMLKRALAWLFNMKLRVWLTA